MIRHVTFGYLIHDELLFEDFQAKLLERHPEVLILKQSESTDRTCYLIII